MSSLQLTALSGIPLIQPGDDLAALILAALPDHPLRDQDVLVITSKIVSKAESRYIDLASVTPSSHAVEVAAETGKDPRIVELVLQESVAISRKGINTLIVRHRLGFVSANAGIDQSNIQDGDERVLLLPRDPDASAQAICEQLRAATGAEVGVIISDSHGRPFRLGNVGVAIGVAGMPALVDLRGQPDLFGRKLKYTIQAYADMVASAASLLSGEANEGRPVVLVRGLQFPSGEGRAADFIRPPEQDLYR